MAFLDFLRPKSGTPVEHVYAVPISARKFTTTGAVPKETYIFYAFLFEESADRAVARLKKEIRDEGLEFVEIAGQVETVPLSGWTDFVAKRFDWIKDALPTAAQIESQSRGLVYYTPKIMQR